MQMNYLDKTIPVVIRLSPKIKDKWKLDCAKKRVTYASWIEQKLSPTK